jgi:Mrp family chromosome partitioning ATPase
LIEKPLIARLEQSDVMRSLSGILTIGGAPDITRLGWPTLRTGLPSTAFPNAIRQMRATAARRSAANAAPVMAAIAVGAGEGRSMAVLNVALAAARDGAKVLIIDADHATQTLSSKANNLGANEDSRLHWLGIGDKTSRTIKTANGISILPVVGRADATLRAIAQARSGGDYDLVVLDGPAMPVSADDRKLLDIADGLVAILPTSLDINECMEGIIAGLGAAERKLVGVVLSDLQPAVINRPRDRQYA